MSFGMTGRRSMLKPAGIEQAKKVMDKVEYSDGPYSWVKGADAVVIVTEWEQFRALDLDQLKERMAKPVVVNLRNIYLIDEMEGCGFVYDSVGRPRTVNLSPK